MVYTIYANFNNSLCLDVPWVQSTHRVSIVYSIHSHISHRSIQQKLQKAQN